jgi:hypothetical protein
MADANQRVNCISHDHPLSYSLLDILQQPAPEDFYSLLGIDPKKSCEQEVKAAYKRLQKITHPDIVGPSANNLAVLLNSCLDILMDESTRRTYDLDLATWRKGLGSFDGRPVRVPLLLHLTIKLR